MDFSVAGAGRLIHHMTSNSAVTISCRFRSSTPILNAYEVLFPTDIARLTQCLSTWLLEMFSLFYLLAFFATFAGAAASTAGVLVFTSRNIVVAEYIPSETYFALLPWWIWHP
jgi:hypothetical protein